MPKRILSTFVSSALILSFFVPVFNVWAAAAVAMVPQADQDITPPSSPSNIRVDAVDSPSSQYPQISWNDPSDNDFKNINIYRSTEKGILGDLIDVAPKTTITAVNWHSDTKVKPGIVYYYTIRSVDNAGNESKNTDQYSYAISRYIKIISPNGGEIWQPGETKRISWNSGDVNYVDIYLYDSNYANSSGSTIKVASNIQASAGYYDWTIPSVSGLPMGQESKNLKIRIDVVGDQSFAYSDHSDEPFSVISTATATTTVTIVSPNGGETFIQATPNIIKWNGGKNKVKIGLVKADFDPKADNPQVWWIHSSAVPNGKTEWHGEYVSDLNGAILPAVIPGSYKILAVSENSDGNYCIWSSENNCNMDISNAPFNIVRKDIKKTDEQISVITEKAKLLKEQNIDPILAELNQLRNLVKEQQNEIRYLKNIVSDLRLISEEMKTVVNNFITYGVDQNTKKLGEGERAAVVHSYKSAFNKLPETEAELSDMIKIANGRFPSVVNEKTEKKAKEQFMKIYKRIPDMNNPKDDAAIKVMAYGLRQKAENRNLNSEKAGIKTFNNIYGYAPKTTDDWNTMQAITYSGASREADSDKDLLPDWRERELGTDPSKADMDGDGYGDGTEVLYGHNPKGK